MKNIMLSIVMVCLLVGMGKVSASDSNYSTKTGVLTIPVIELDGVPFLSDVSMVLNTDGKFEITGYKSYRANTSFTINAGYLITDDIYITKDNKMIQIVGVYTGKGYYYLAGNNELLDYKFKPTTDNLPRADYGETGKYYFLLDKGIAFANYL